MTETDEKKEDVDFVRSELLTEFESFARTTKGKRLIKADLDKALLTFSEYLAWLHQTEEVPADEGQQQ